MTNEKLDTLDFPVPGMITGNFSKKFLKSLGLVPIHPPLFTKKVKTVQSSGRCSAINFALRYAENCKNSTEDKNV